jgi:uncharacterized protein with PIN domain
MKNIKPHIALFRFYEELNDFLPAEKRKVQFEYRFDCSPSVKDAVEAMGVPHTEIDMIIVNGVSVTFSYNLRDNDSISVYPVFESFDISEITHLREKPLREPKFIADVHLGKLARQMRLLGLDTVYENNLADDEIIRRSLFEKRAILTRDKGILMNRAVTHACWIRSTNYREQLEQVIKRFDLNKLLNPFTRCLDCNGFLEKAPKEEILSQLEHVTALYYNEFRRCMVCGKIFWKGSHYLKMKKFVDEFMTSNRSMFSEKY